MTDAVEGSTAPARAADEAAQRCVLLYLAASDDPQRFAVGPVLAAAAEAAGWAFECYYDAHRAGRHFGAGAPEDAPRGWPNGSLVVGGGHASAIAALARSHRVVAIGDARSLLWPILDDLGVECLGRTSDPLHIQLAVLERLGQPRPALALVLDGTPQGFDGVITAPFLYPRIMEAPALAIDVSADAEVVRGLVDLGIRLQPVACDAGRLARFPSEIPAQEIEPTPPGGWGAVTAAFALRSRDWGRGVFLGDAHLVAAHLAKAARLRLLPLHGRPTADVLDRVSGLVEAAAEPVFGRQWDDHDFFLLARRGHGLHVVDPPPPFDAVLPPVAAPDVDELALDEPSDEQLEQWAADGRVLTTLLFWTGMLRELDGLPRLIDLIAATGIRAGLVVTAETVERMSVDVVAALVASEDRGGVLGHAELLVGSTGRGVAAEQLLPHGVLAASLTEARRSFDRLPPALRPVGWWPLLDTSLERGRRRVVGVRNGRPVVWFTPRGGSAGQAPDSAPRPTSNAATARRDVRSIVGEIIRRTGRLGVLEMRRPFQDQRPGPLDRAVFAQVKEAGFSYMWTKADFGQPAISHRDGSFVALPFTAGAWDGWSPFYTVRSRHAVERAASRLRRRGGPGWLVSTVDSPLFAMSGEVLEHGHVLHELASAVADDGGLGLVNVLPRTVARYARLLDDMAAESPSSAR